MNTSMWDDLGRIMAETFASHQVIKINMRVSPLITISIMMQVIRSQRLAQRAWTQLTAVLTDELLTAFKFGKCAHRRVAGNPFRNVSQYVLYL